MPSFAPGTQYYIPVTLTNNQSTATPSNFTVSISVNQSTYSSYLASNLSNINWQDGAGNILNSWREAGTSNTGTNGLWWVNLGTLTISANSTLTIYLCFYATSQNVLNTTNTGVAPQLTTPYAQYDNGTSVFKWYENFAGTSLPSDMSAVAIGTSTYSVNNGLTINPGASGDGTVIYKTTGLASPVYLDCLVTAVSGSNYALMGQQTATPTSQSTNGIWTSLNSSYQWFAGNGTTYAQIELDSSDTPSTVLAGVTSSPPAIISGAWSATGTEQRMLNYGNAGTGTDSTLTLPATIYPELTGYGNGGSSSQTWQWFRARLYPPNNAMPAATFGSIGIAGSVKITETASLIASSKIASEINLSSRASLIQSQRVSGNAKFSILGEAINHGAVSIHISLRASEIASSLFAAKMRISVLATIISNSIISGKTKFALSAATIASERAFGETVISLRALVGVRPLIHISLAASLKASSTPFCFARLNLTASLVNHSLQAGAINIHLLASEIASSKIAGELSLLTRATLQNNTSTVTSTHLNLLAKTIISQAIKGEISVSLHAVAKLTQVVKGVESLQFHGTVIASSRTKAETDISSRATFVTNMPLKASGIFVCRALVRAQMKSLGESNLSVNASVYVKSKLALQLQLLNKINALQISNKSVALQTRTLQISKLIAVGITERGDFAILNTSFYTLTGDVVSAARLIDYGGFVVTQSST